MLITGCSEFISESVHPDFTMRSGTLATSGDVGSAVHSFLICDSLVEAMAKNCKGCTVVVVD